MNDKKLQALLWGAFLVLLSALFLIGTAGLAYAGPELPPRETPVPAQPPQDGDGNYNEPVGAHIVLHVPSASVWILGSPDTAWTLVQWQDSAGSWHDVDGWQGTLDHGDQKIWWLAPDLFGKGPFRWLVYRGADRDRLIATSDAFYLPDSPGAELQIQVTLPD
jgi:hypothetical protein